MAKTYFISLFAGEIKGSFGLSDGQWAAYTNRQPRYRRSRMVGPGVLMTGFGYAVCRSGMRVWRGPLSGMACRAELDRADACVIYALRLTGQE